MINSIHYYYYYYYYFIWRYRGDSPYTIMPYLPSMHKHLLILKHPSIFAFNFYTQASDKPRKGRPAVQDQSAGSLFSYVLKLYDQCHLHKWSYSPARVPCCSKASGTGCFNGLLVLVSVLCDGILLLQPKPTSDNRINIEK